MDTVQKITIAGASRAPGTDLFQEHMDKLFSIGLAVSSPRDEPFHTQMTAYCGRNLRFAALRFSPHTTASSHRGQRASRLLVSLQQDGVALVQQDGRESRIEAGDMFMIDPSRPFSIETGEIVTHSIYLEPEAIRAVLPEAETLTARAVRCDKGAAAVFRGMADAMFAAADLLDEATADRLADGLPHVLCAAFAGLAGGSASIPPSRLRLMHKQRILRCLRENLRNHELDAEMVANGVNLSTRYVYELFEDEGQPLMRWIWNSRLDRCRADLATPALASRSIGEIAFYWGFNDVAHFSRAFRQRFGQSPREYRSAQRGVIAA
jgi:AraC family transcriptional activator of tynA and feaB